MVGIPTYCSILVAVVIPTCFYILVVVVIPTYCCILVVVVLSTYCCLLVVVVMPTTATYLYIRNRIRNEQAVIRRLSFWALTIFYGTGGVRIKVPI